MVHPDKVGKYELEKFLGGGMSHVYRAKDTVLGRRVTVKILTEAGVGDAEAKARFLQEARMASNIHHENIIRIYDFGEENGRPYMVMEYLEGQSLREAIKTNRAGNFDQRLRIAVQVARALDFIHSRKIVHRDVKPENIHVDSAGRARLMDFGIAKMDGQALTREGVTVGTPYYMAPEQVLGQPLTPQADVYAFGILLYELLTGVKPVAGDSLEQVFQNILYQPIDLKPLDAAGVPLPVRSLIARCTEKQLIQRPASLGWVADELERFLQPLPPGPPRHPPPPPGLLSPSSLRPISETRLPMPPPPPARAPSPLDRLRALMQTPAAVMVGTALVIVAVTLGVFALLVLAGWV